jgi:hypothetical protein
MARPLSFSVEPIQTRLPEEENKKFKRLMVERKVGRSKLARTLILEALANA